MIQKLIYIAPFRLLLSAYDKGFEKMNVDSNEYAEVVPGYLFTRAQLDGVSTNFSGAAYLTSLSVGSVADVAILNLHEGKFEVRDTSYFGFFDYTGHKIEGKQKLECEMTIRKGKIVYDLNGIANPVVVTQQPRS